MKSILSSGVPSNALLAVTGTVGTGKSTLTEKLAQSLDFQAYFERVDNNPYLQDYYRNFKRWSFHMQMYFLVQKLKTQKEIFDANSRCILDRTIYEDVGIFAQMHYEKGNMSDREFTTYKELFYTMLDTPYCRKPDLLIYIDGPLTKIIERVHSRGREIETLTPFDFWEELHQRYQAWIESFTEAPVLKINIEDYDCFDPDSIQEIVRKISRSFILKEENRNPKSVGI